MLNAKELERLLTAMRMSKVTTLDVKNKKQRLRLQLPTFVSAPSAAPASAQLTGVSPDVEHVSAVSPSIGTFLHRGIDDGLALLTPGMRVIKGDILGYVCQGPVRVVVDSPISGVVISQGPDDGALLGLGDPIFTVELLHEN